MRLDQRGHVEQVTEGGSAARAGLPPGAQIVSVNGHEVHGKRGVIYELRRCDQAAVDGDTVDFGAEYQAEASWEAPPGWEAERNRRVFEAWEQHLDQESGRAYYVHLPSNTPSWEAPEGWEDERERRQEVSKAVKMAELRTADARESRQLVSVSVSPASAAKPAVTSATRGASHRPAQAALADLLHDLFERVDADSDGSVSRTEIVKALRKDPQFAEMLGLPRGWAMLDGEKGERLGWGTEDEGVVTQLYKMEYKGEEQLRLPATTTAEASVCIVMMMPDREDPSNDDGQGTPSASSLGVVLTGVGGAPPKTRIRIHGLTSAQALRQKLNGKLGSIVAWMESKGRYLVQLDGLSVQNRPQLSLRAANVELLSSAPSEDNAQSTVAVGTRVWSNELYEFT
jgi:hypothetical protein